MSMDRTNSTNGGGYPPSRGGSSDGIDPADRDTVLQRFGRSRVRPGDEGFGLGLSIVHAIVEAHGGSVAIHDAEPCGARVELTLPTDPSKETPWPRS